MSDATTGGAARPALAFVGGTGKEGCGLAARFAAVGHPVLIGSRDAARAVDAVARLRDRLARAGSAFAACVEGMSNDGAIAGAEIVFVTVPYAAFDTFLHERGAALAGKIVVDVVNPLRVVGGRFELIPVPEGSAALHLARLAPDARIVAGFKNAAAAHLLALGVRAEGDILLASDDAAAKAIVAGLVREIPDLRPVDAGPLANGGFLESITALQLNLNRLHKATTAIRILGL